MNSKGLQPCLCSSVSQSCLILCDPWTVACQTSLSLTISQSLIKLITIESMMPAMHLIFCLPLLLLPSFFPSIKVFSNELALCIRWPKYWSFSFSISTSNEYSGLIGLIDLNSLQPKDSQEFSPAPQFESINSSGLRLICVPTLTSIHDYWKNHSFDNMDLC